MKKLHLGIFIVSFALAFASLAISAYYWNMLPVRIPTHFGVAGTPDAWMAKNFFSVFFIPMLQLLLSGLFFALYFRPQYTSWPTTMMLMTVEKTKREKIFNIIREMNACISFIIALLFTYIQITVITTALDLTSGLNPWAMLGWIIVLFGLLIYYNARIYKLVKRLTA